MIWIFLSNLKTRNKTSIVKAGKMNIWDLKAPFYHMFRKIWPLNLIHKKETTSIQTLLSSIGDRQDVVLDMGCGCGDSFHLIQNAKHTFGMDQSLVMVKRYRNKTQRPVFVAKAEHLPLKSGSVSLFYVIGVCEYIKELSITLKEWKRSCRPTGNVILTSSPPVLFNKLRIIGGNRLYLRTSNVMKNLIKLSGFYVQKNLNSGSQQAFLLSIKNPGK